MKIRMDRPSPIDGQSIENPPANLAGGKKITTLARRDARRLRARARLSRLHCASV